MKKIDCIIRPSKLEEVEQAFRDFGIRGMTVSNVLGCGLQLGKTEIYRGSTYNINLLPKVKLEIVVPDDKVEELVDIIQKTAYTGKIGDGKIFIYDIQDALRIRTGDMGENAI